MQNNTSYKHCLNCQTELHGDYCHVCGQYAGNVKPTVKEFILEYLNIAFIWDQHFLKTIWQLFRKPGYVTKEYVSGKFVSYTHPLKLNMFLLFVFVTLFLLFHKDLGDSIQKITRDEVTNPVIQLQILTENENYADRLQTSALDTVKLYAPLIVAEKFSDIVTAIESAEGVSADSMIVWKASLPHILIEDEVIIPSHEGYYYFSDENQTGVIGAQFLENIWSELIKLTTTYFPIFILLTVPFLAFILRLTHRKEKRSKFEHFIFSLHYTAFLEMLIILLYITHLIAAPPVWIMQWIMILGACVYLTMAIKKVYETKNWLIAVGQAAIINFGYVTTLILTFCVVFMILCIIVAIKLLV